MSRLTFSDQVFFPVTVRPVHVDVGVPEPGTFKRAPGKRAIVNQRDLSIVGVVGSGYRLVTNEEAFEAAKTCCTLAFPETGSGEWRIGSVDAPETGSYCHIDLVHSTAELDFEFRMTGERPEVPEIFGPFVRVSNSYNGRRALAFTIGFHRKVCANGLVGPESVVQFQFAHTRDQVGDGIRFQIDHTRLDAMKTEFLDCFRVLRDFPVERSYFVPLIRFVLKLPDGTMPPASDRSPGADRERRDQLLLLRYLEEVSARYVREQGDNAYAVLNAMTEIASHPSEINLIRRDKHSLQKLAGEWMVEFRKHCLNPSFTVGGYLEERDRPPAD